MSDAKSVTPINADPLGPNDTGSQPTTLTLTGALKDGDALRKAIRAASGDHTRSLGLDLATVTDLSGVVVGILLGSLIKAERSGTSLVIAVAAGSIPHSILRDTGVPHVVV